MFFYYTQMKKSREGGIALHRRSTDVFGFAVYIFDAAIFSSKRAFALIQTG